MKILPSKTVTKKELQDKVDTAMVAQDYLREHIQPIHNVRVGLIKVTHSHNTHAAFADPKRAFTALIPTELIVGLKSLVAVYRQVNKLFKDCGEPQVYWDRKGLMLTIGFNIDKQRMERLQDLFS